MNRDNAEGTARKRAGFIKHNRIDRGKRLQVIAALGSKCALARAADTTENESGTLMTSAQGQPTTRNVSPRKTQSLNAPKPSREKQR